MVLKGFSFLFVITLLHVMQQCQGDEQTELYSSMYQLEHAFQSFKQRRNAFHKRVAELDSARYKMGRYALDGLAYYENLDYPFANPSDVYQITELMYDLHRAMHQEKRFYRQHLSMPADVQGIIHRLLSLQWMYDVPAHELAEGYFTEDVPKGRRLNTQQRYTVSIIANRHGIYSQESAWVYEVLRSQQEEITSSDYHPLMFPDIQSRLMEYQYLNKLIGIFLRGNKTKLAEYIADTLTHQFGYHNFNYLSKESGGLFKRCMDLGIWDDPMFEGEMVMAQMDEDYKLKATCIKERLKRTGYCRYASPTPFHLLAPVEEEVISKSPHIRMWHRVIKDEVAETMINDTIPHMKRASMVDPNNPGSQMVSERRVSQHHFIINPEDEEVYEDLDKWLQDLTGVTIEEANRNAEPYQTNNYGIGGFYGTHYDFVEYNTKETPRSFNDLPTGQFSNRIATIMLYLTDSVGGGTVFPNLNISIMPRKGSVLFWYNLLRSGEGDRRTLHAGCPVVAGSKWVVNKWVRYHGQMYSRPCTLHKTADD